MIVFWWFDCPWLASQYFLNFDRWHLLLLFHLFGLWISFLRSVSNYASRSMRQNVYFWFYDLCEFVNIIFFESSWRFFDLLKPIVSNTFIFLVELSSICDFLQENSQLSLVLGIKMAHWYLRFDEIVNYFICLYHKFQLFFETFKYFLRLLIILQFFNQFLQWGLNIF